MVPDDDFLRVLLCLCGLFAVDSLAHYLPWCIQGRILVYYQPVCFCCVDVFLIPS